MKSNITFTLLQSDLIWENKIANLQHFKNQIDSIQQATQIIVLPEMFNTGFSMNPKELAETMQGNTMQWLTALSNEKKAIITGSLMIEEGGKYFNRLVWMQPNGQFHFYDKRHLFSFGNEDKFFKAGDKRLITQANGWKICTQICYDLRFPVWQRMRQSNEYDVLVIVANWPEKRSHAWRCLLIARAIENQCYVVAVNRIGFDVQGNAHRGDSCVIDPLGEILYQHSFENDTFTISLDKEKLEQVRVQFPFANDKDDFILV
jgi:omega-amidase